MACWVLYRQDVNPQKQQQIISNLLTWLDEFEYEGGEVLPQRQLKMFKLFRADTLNKLQPVLLAAPDEPRHAQRCYKYIKVMACGDILEHAAADLWVGTHCLKAGHPKCYWHDVNHQCLVIA